MVNYQQNDSGHGSVTPAQLLNDLWKTMKPAYNQYVQSGGQSDMQMLLDDWAAGLDSVGIKLDNKARVAALLALLPVIYADGTDPQDMASCLMFALASPKMKPGQGAAPIQQVPAQPNNVNMSRQARRPQQRPTVQTPRNQPQYGQPYPPQYQQQAPAPQGGFWPGAQHDGGFPMPQ